MNEMFRGIEFIKAYIDGILIITKGDWSNHLNTLELGLKNLRSKGIKCNIEKSNFGTDQDEISGFLGDTDRYRTSE